MASSHAMRAPMTICRSSKSIIDGSKKCKRHFIFSRPERAFAVLDASSNTACNRTSSDTPNSAQMTALPALEARFQQDLAWLELPAKPWLPPKIVDDGAVLDVAVIGGGQVGMAAAASFVDLGIGAVIYDQSPAGFEGPWATT